MRTRFIFITILLAGLVGCATTASRRDDAHSRKAYDWLCAQQGPHGILGNQDGESFAGLYPNALAAMAFLERGDRERCERVLDFFDARRAELRAKPGGFPQFYDAATGKTHADSDRWMGDNCWLLIALNHYAARTGSDRYRAMAGEIADWLVGLQDADGGIWAGFNKDGPMKAKSTEGNLDAVAALTSRPEARAKIERWLWERMWIPEEGRFRMGSTDPNPALDTSSWGVLALGQRAWPSMEFAERTLRVEKRSDANGKLITGFTDFVGKDRIWLEGTGEMACAYRVSGRERDALFYIGELEKALVPSAAHPGTMSIPCHTNDPSWDGGATKGFVPSVCWYLFAKWNFNPMQGFAP